MITADTSTWVAFLDGPSGEDVLLLKKTLQAHQLSMLPVVLTELLSDPNLPPAVAASLMDLPLIEVESGFWQRAGALRAKVLAKRRRARLADSLIAQLCLDASLSLITRDRDFRSFAEVSTLQLLLSP
ncbi:MAG: PIN domain-containing protein [Candidatus Acidiferrum sp.]